MVDKISSYTGAQFDQFEVVSAVRAGKAIVVIHVTSAETPMVCENPGTYAVPPGKNQKTAFGRGTLFFRHGAKSEPAKHSDVSEIVTRLIEAKRKNWFRGIRQVIEAQPGENVQVVRSSANSDRSLRSRIVSDVDARPVRPAEADSLWPHRQIDVIKKVNAALRGEAAKISFHDILCVKKQHNIDKYSEFTYRPFLKSSPQYSDAFIDWLTEQFRRDAQFFAKARAAHKASS